MDTVIATVQVDQELTDITMEALGLPNARKLLRKETQRELTTGKVFNRIRNGWQPEDKNDHTLLPYLRRSDHSPTTMT